jgi:hypothetical protein
VSGLFGLFAGDADQRWWNATTISGKPAGLGFLCPTCGLRFPHSAPDRIEHCGSVECAPTATEKLPTRSLGAQLPRNVFLVGDWGTTEREEAESTPQLGVTYR